MSVLLDDLDPAERAALVGMLANPEWRHTAISDALNEEGYSMTAKALAHCRNGKCTHCPSEEWRQA